MRYGHAFLILDFYSAPLEPADLTLAPPTVRVDGPLYSLAVGEMSYYTRQCSSIGINAADEGLVLAFTARIMASAL
jgi:hypothetical protein